MVRRLVATLLFATIGVVLNLACAANHWAVAATVDGLPSNTRALQTTDEEKQGEDEKDDEKKDAEKKDESADDSQSPEEDKSPEQKDSSDKDADGDNAKKPGKKSDDSAQADADESTEDKSPKEVKKTEKDGEAADDSKASDDKKANEKKPADTAKAAEEKKPEEKKAAEKKPEPKKPETHKVAVKDLKIEVEVDGVFVAKEAEEVPLRPEVWTSFKVLEAVPHGKRVRKGDVLVKFDPKEIDESIAEKAIEDHVGELTLMAAEEEFPRLEKSVKLNYEQAEREQQQAADEYDRFQKTMRELSEKMAKYYLNSAEQDLDNAREELTQLEKMYEADELTEETEEIVLRRQKFQVKAAEFFMEYSKINHDYTMSVSIPERDKLLSTAVEQAKISFERAKMAKSLGLNKERYELQALREARGRTVENYAKLQADRAFMELKAPADGIAYYGRCVNGRWLEVSGMEQKLIPYGSVSPNSVVMTIVKDRPMYAETSIGEKELPTVKKGQKATLVPAADDELELEAKVDSVADVPGGGNKFTVKLSANDAKTPDWLMPGMSLKAKIQTYETKDAVVVPVDLVQSDKDSPKKKYVMLEVEDEDKPVRRDIKLGKKKDKEVEVVKGLKKGDVIVKGAKDGDEEDTKADESKSEKKDDSEEAKKS